MLISTLDSVQSVLEEKPSPQSKVYLNRSPSGSSDDAEKEAFSFGRAELQPEEREGWPGGEFISTVREGDHEEDAPLSSSALARISYIPALSQQWTMLISAPDSVQSVLEEDPSPQSKVYLNRSSSGSSDDAEKEAFSFGRAELRPDGMEGWPGGELTDTTRGEDQGEELLASIALTVT